MVAGKEQGICPQMNTDKIYIVREEREQRKKLNKYGFFALFAFFADKK